MKLWEKGLSSDTNIELFTVGNDRELDLQLAEYDVTGSIAHSRMLGQTGLITQSETDELVSALQEILVLSKRGNLR